MVISSSSMDMPLSFPVCCLPLTYAFYLCLYLPVSWINLNELTPNEDETELYLISCVLLLSANP